MGDYRNLISLASDGSDGNPRLEATLEGAPWVWTVGKDRPE